MIPMSPSGVRYAEDVTLRDVEAMQSFLVARAAPLAAAERGSVEREMSRGVEVAALQLVGTLQHSLSLVESESEVVRIQLRRQIISSWNLLWALVSPWQLHDEFDRTRWRYVKYWNAGDQMKVEALLTGCTSSVDPPGELEG